jgi:hypothetical protein
MAASQRRARTQLRAGGDDRPRVPVGLAANGQAGVGNVLDILRGGIDSALLGLGKASIGDLALDDLVIPPGFTRILRGDGSVFDSVPGGQAVTD